MKASDWAAGAMMLFLGSFLFIWLDRWVEAIGMFVVGWLFVGISYVMRRK